MRTRALLGLAAVLAGLPACYGDGGGAHFERQDVRSLVLAPRDVGRGYALGDDTACGRFHLEEASGTFTDFVRETDPVGCAVEVVYIWGGVREKVVPRAVDSGAVVFDDEADARRGIELREDLITFVSGETPRDFEEVPEFGHEPMRFRNPGFDVQPGAGVIWRNGNMIAVALCCRRLHRCRGAAAREGS
jgi:hypothetical protein